MTNGWIQSSEVPYPVNNPVASSTEFEIQLSYVTWNHSVSMHRQMKRCQWMPHLRWCCHWLPLHSGGPPGFPNPWHPEVAPFPSAAPAKAWDHLRCGPGPYRAVEQKGNGESAHQAWKSILVGCYSENLYHENNRFGKIGKISKSNLYCSAVSNCLIIVHTPLLLSWKSSNPPASSCNPNPNPDQPPSWLS